ncbi:MAG TPA: CRISPR-associated endonuclease Cas6 [Bacteroidales bacterium]|nr:CRISPR-associated endonuclease Cas6 [Bacteroidales bacterium]HPR59067.1 CRISPR-associated endonuclease Cas6 [Bacteroidales bacterium]
MKKIRMLTVTFDTHLRGYEIPAFRGAVIQKVGMENVLFHNHLSGKTFLYKYPLVQYKAIGGKPSIICIEYGVDEIYKFFEKSDWSLKVSDRWLDMKISKLYLNQFVMQVWDKKWHYTITNWIALNQENYRKFAEIEALSEQIIFLERTLTANIISMAKGIEWDVDKPIQLTIKQINNSRLVKIKDNMVNAFTIDFTANVFLPDYIGLGKSVSLGYGVVRRKQTEKK